MEEESPAPVEEPVEEPAAGAEAEGSEAGSEEPAPEEAASEAGGEASGEKPSGCAALAKNKCKVTKGCAWNDLGKCVDDEGGP